MNFELGKGFLELFPVYDEYREWFLKIWEHYPDETTMGVSFIDEAVALRRDIKNGSTDWWYSSALYKQLEILTLDEFKQNYLNLNTFGPKN